MVTKRKVNEKDERTKNLKKVKNKLSTHVLEVELDVLGHQKKVIEDSHEHARIIRNTVMGEMMKKLEQMKRTRIYRQTMSEYIELKKKIISTEKQIEKKNRQKERKRNEENPKRIKRSIKKCK